MSSLPPLLPDQHPQQQCQVGERRSQTGGGWSETDWKRHQRERVRNTAVLGFINNRVQKTRWVWPPLSAHLPGRGQAWAALCPPCPCQGLSLGRLPFSAKLCSSPPSSHQTPPHSQEGLVPIWGALPQVLTHGGGPFLLLPTSLSWAQAYSTNGATFPDRPKRFLSADEIWVGGWIG